MTIQGLADTFGNDAIILNLEDIQHALEQLPQSYRKEDAHNWVSTHDQILVDIKNLITRRKNEKVDIQSEEMIKEIKEDIKKGNL